MQYLPFAFSSNPPCTPWNAGGVIGVHVHYLAVLLGRFRMPSRLLIFVFNDTATTEIYTLSLHDALPIFRAGHRAYLVAPCTSRVDHDRRGEVEIGRATSELQSLAYIVCPLLLQKKK